MPSFTSQDLYSRYKPDGQSRVIVFYSAGSGMWLSQRHKVSDFRTHLSYCIFQLSDFGSHITDSVLQISNYIFHIPYFRFHIPDSILIMSDFMFRISELRFHISIYNFQNTYFGCHSPYIKVQVSSFGFYMSCLCVRCCFRMQSSCFRIPV